MKKTKEYLLDRPARKAGGDRYIEQLQVNEVPMMETAYVDQSMSRLENMPKAKLWITISDEPPED